MPELPGRKLFVFLAPKELTRAVVEVERAARLLNVLGTGKEIAKVETVEDTIVYSGVTSAEFVSSCHYNEVFMTVDSSRRHP
jgi:hypothetical protein